MYSLLSIFLLINLLAGIIASPFPLSSPDSEITPVDETASEHSGNGVSPGGGIDSDPNQILELIASDDSSSNDQATSPINTDADQIISTPETEPNPNPNDQATSPINTDADQIISDAETQPSPIPDDQDSSPFQNNGDQIISDSGVQTNPSPGLPISTIDPGAQVVSNPIDQSSCNANPQKGSISNRDDGAACYVRDGLDDGSNTGGSAGGPTKYKLPRPGNAPLPKPGTPIPKPASRKQKQCSANLLYTEHLCCDGGASVTANSFAENLPIYKSVDYCIPC